LSVGIIGILKTNMPVWERVLFAVIGIGMVSPLGVYKLAGLVLFTGMVVQHYWRNKKTLENPQPDTL
ncbi:MAG TPA: C4-dicarboxylate ABC transporter permease, partial [Thermovirga lienii]|nr:C4-dicarboxylate ABC transporter permease [Thermovirga lienii]